MNEEMYESIKEASFNDEMDRLEEEYYKKENPISKAHPVGDAIDTATPIVGFGAGGVTGYAVAKKLRRLGKPFIATGILSGLASGALASMGGYQLNKRFNPYTKKVDPLFNEHMDNMQKIIDPRVFD